MIAFDYLRKGLNALARAHRMGSMAGHLGASLIPGYFVGEQRPDLDPEVDRGIEGDLGRVMRGESVFGRKMSKNAPLSDPELFEPFRPQKPNGGVRRRHRRSAGEEHRPAAPVRPQRHFQ